MASSDEDSGMSKPSGPGVKPSATPLQPSLPWRMTSSLVMGLTAALSKGFLYTFNSVEVTGLDGFLKILDERKDVEKRERGLITVSNHTSVLDDPLMWGVLPLRYAFNPSNMRWGLGAHDICYKNKALGSFFYCGQVLPTHRSLHSPHGGLFQSTIPQAIRLLSAQPFTTSPRALGTSQKPSNGNSSNDSSSDNDLATFTTTGLDRYVSPSLFSGSNRHAWVHIFPEACVHQHPRAALRYFKWGVSRLILESEPAPDVVPMFLDGASRIMPEDRGFPRFLPRVGVRLRVAFGDALDADRAFGDLRARWRDLVRRSAERAGRPEVASAAAMGDLSDELRYGKEAVELRIECARRVREEVLRLRRRLGYPDEDPALGLAENWTRREPASHDKFRSPVDGSLVNKKD